MAASFEFSISEASPEYVGKNRKVTIIKIIQNLADNDFFARVTSGLKLSIDSKLIIPKLSHNESLGYIKDRCRLKSLTRLGAIMLFGDDKYFVF